MSETPYSPPRARVSDPLEERQPRPLSVTRAAMFLWISAAGTGLLTVLQLIGVIPTDNLGATAAIGLVSFAVLGFIAEKLRTGRGWVRWLFLAIYVFGSLGFVASLILASEAFFSQPLLLQGSAAIQLALQTAALVFMFQRASATWFRQASAL